MRLLRSYIKLRLLPSASELSNLDLATLQQTGKVVPQDRAQLLVAGGGRIVQSVGNHLA
jgi:hypothetical protein